MDCYWTQSHCLTSVCWVVTNAKICESSSRPTLRKKIKQCISQNVEQTEEPLPPQLLSAAVYWQIDSLSSSNQRPASSADKTSLEVTPCHLKPISCPTPGRDESPTVWPSSTFLTTAPLLPPSNRICVCKT